MPAAPVRFADPVDSAMASNHASLKNRATSPVYQRWNVGRHGYGGA